MPTAALPALILAALSVATAPVAHADSARPSQTRAGPNTQPKECPRLNSRFGYYANPWCTEAEQRAWDIWEARARHRSATK
jgi:hypothetical protein